MSVLDDILAATKLEIERLRALPRRPTDRRPLDVASRLHRGQRRPLSIIAEIKKRSPSAGALSRVLDVPSRARVYERAGATMISVLVDRAHFDGAYEDLMAARAFVDTPLLCKGFILDPVQVDAAADAGADAVLLIARILDDATMSLLSKAIRDRGMTPIVEVTDEAELSRALAIEQASTRVIGVNARDLATLHMDRERAVRLIDAVPTSAVALYFSGLGSADEVRAVATPSPPHRPADGALIGEALMRADDPEPLLRSMVEAAVGG
jgi:indole-3-glycerol phosphate synthase